MLTFRGSVPCLDDVPKPKDGTEKNGRKTLRLGRSQESHAEFGSAHVDEDEGTKGRRARAQTTPCVDNNCLGAA